MKDLKRFLQRFSWVFEEIFEELEEEDSRRRGFRRIQQLYEDFEQMNVETRVFNFLKSLFAAGCKKPQHILNYLLRAAKNRNIYSTCAAGYKKTVVFD